jgi:hypothetical protein
MSDDRPIQVTVYGEDEHKPLRQMFIHPDQPVTEFGVTEPKGVIVDGEVFWSYEPVLVTKIVVLLPGRKP